MRKRRAGTAKKDEVKKPTAHQEPKAKEPKKLTGRARSLQNLKPPFTSANAAENGAKGGKASGAARRKKKAMAELASLMLTSELPKDSKMAGGIKAIGASLEPDDLTTAAAIVAGMVNAAIKGNVKAAELLLELEGQEAGKSGAIDIMDDPLSAALLDVAKELDGGID